MSQLTLEWARAQGEDAMGRAADRAERARAGRDGMLRGMEASAAHAERETPSWQDQAYEHLLSVVAKGVDFIAPDVRRTFQGPAAPTAYAWGAVLQRANRAGVIVRAGTTFYGDETMHTQNVTVWRPRA